MSLVYDLDIQKLLSGTNCDIIDIVDVIEGELEKIKTEELEFQDVKEEPLDVDTPAISYRKDECKSEYGFKSEYPNIEDETIPSPWKSKKLEKSLDVDTPATSYAKDNFKSEYGFKSEYLNIEDETIPWTWKSKKSNKSLNYVFYSPDGKVFKTRRQGLCYLIENNFHQSDIDEMRSCLVWEGWLDHDYLPPRWKYRKIKKNVHRIAVMSDKGNVFKTQKKCLEYMEHERYNPLLVEEFKTFAQEELCKNPIQLKINLKREYSNYINSTGDIDQTGDGATPLSPDVKSEQKSKKFKSGENNEKLVLWKSDTTIDNTHALESDNIIDSGWLKSEYLPEDWLYKEPNSDYPYLWIKSREGNRLKSYKQVMAFLKCTDTYSQTDVDKFSLFKSRPMKQNHKVGIKEWRKSQYLPEGWMYRIPNKADSVCVKSSDGIRFSSNKAIVSYFESRSEYTEIDRARLSLFTLEVPAQRTKERNIEKTPKNFKRKKIQLTEWKTSIYLPAGWMYRKPNKANAVCVKSSDGTIFISYKSIISYLQSNQRHTEQDTENLSLFQQESNIEFNRHMKQNHTKVQHEIPKFMMKKWMKSEYLPEGWMYRRPNKADAVCVKSSDGIRFKSYRSIISYFESNSEYTASDIERLSLFTHEVPAQRTKERNGKNKAKSKSFSRKKTQKKEWQTSVYLPEGWMYGAPNIAHAVCVKASDTTILSSYKSIISYFESHIGFTETDTDRLTLFQQEYQSVYKKSWPKKIRYKRAN